MVTDPDMQTVEQQLAIQIGTIHAEFHDRLQLGEDELKRNVNALEKAAYEKGVFWKNLLNRVINMRSCHSSVEILKIESMAAERARQSADLNAQAQQMKEQLKRKFASTPWFFLFSSLLSLSLFFVRVSLPLLFTGVSLLLVLLELFISEKQADHDENDPSLNRDCTLGIP